jgi:phenylacetate-CoA ligase
VEGRLTHFLTRQGQRIFSPQQVDEMIGGPQWLDLYQLEQVEDNDFLLKIVVNDSYTPGAENEFIAKLEDALGTAIRVNTSVVDYIATERTGKFQSCRGLN